MTNPELAKVLNKAADLLQKHGWCRHRLQDYKGRMCIMGAIDKTSGLISGFSDHQLVVAMGFRDRFHAVNWNNEKARDRYAVTRRLRNAAARLMRAK